MSHPSIIPDWQSQAVAAGWTPPATPPVDLSGSATATHAPGIPTPDAVASAAGGPAAEPTGYTPPDYTHPVALPPALLGTDVSVAAAPIVVNAASKPVGPRGFTTTEVWAAAVVAVAVIFGTVVLLIVNPDRTQLNLVTGGLTKLVVLALGILASRGLAKFGQGTSSTLNASKENAPS